MQGKEAATRSLPKRFYKTVAIAATVPSPEGSGEQVGAYRVLLDDKPVLTPAGARWEVPTAALAEAVAAEWRAQGDQIDAGSMPLLKLTNSAIDGVRGREEEVRAEIAKYAASDLLCYRADGPQELTERQEQLWDPILAWSRESLGAEFQISAGVMPVAQPETARAAVVRALANEGAFELAALHVMTTLTGSTVLALAHAHGRLGVADAWEAAHVDEDWQVGRWGEDADAAARRQRRWGEMQAASHMLTLIKEPCAGALLM
jgi:chaperone required for assembly of F1-ATPase